MNYIYGINAVSEALKARGRAFQWVGMAKERHDIRLQRMIEDCRKLGVPVSTTWSAPSVDDIPLSSCSMA
jgi:hypothetical protein